VCQFFIQSSFERQKAAAGASAAEQFTLQGKRNAKLADAMTHRELFVFARDLRPFNRAFGYRIWPIDGSASF